MDPDPADKAALRLWLLDRARALSAEERAEASSRVQDRLLALSAFAAARVIALYAPLPAELSTERLFARARAAGKTVVLPGYADREPELRAAGEPAELTERRHGFLQPPPGPAVPAAEVDLFVVPGVAFDRGGRRLGRGQGYYDRLLAAARPDAWRAGVCFDHALLPRLPAQPHDAPVDYVATPSALLRTGQRR